MEVGQIGLVVPNELTAVSSTLTQWYVHLFKVSNEQIISEFVELLHSGRTFNIMGDA